MVKSTLHYDWRGRHPAWGGTVGPNDMNIKEALRKLPKTDLHCHLDGSMRPETILELAKEQNLPLAMLSIEELKTKLVCGNKVTSLPVFLQAFDITCSVMQTEKALTRIAFELMEDAAKENVRYLEIRYHPNFMTGKGLSLEQVVIAVEQGIHQAKKKYDIEAGTIICAIRTFSVQDSEKLASFAVDMKKHGVVGFDIAGAEKGFPAADHKKAFDIAAKGGLGITVHAGEDEQPWSIEQAIDICHAQRIGHGRTLIDDEKLIKKVIDKNVFVELCPSSNVQIDLTKDFQSHPARKLFEKSVPVTLNTDNRLLTGIEVSDEYKRCNEILGMDLKALSQIAMNGFKAGFLSTEKKKELIRNIEREISSLQIQKV